MIHGMSVVDRVIVKDSNLRELSRLGFKQEPAGKLRAFAMLDIITQWVFKSLHDKIFDILRLIPQDGTFDQIAPVNLLLSRIKDAGSKRPLHSLDLSAATDRIPVSLAVVLLSGFIGSDLADSWKTL